MGENLSHGASPSIFWRLEDAHPSPLGDSADSEELNSPHHIALEAAFRPWLGNPRSIWRLSSCGCELSPGKLLGLRWETHLDCNMGVAHQLQVSQPSTRFSRFPEGSTLEHRTFGCPRNWLSCFLFFHTSGCPKPRTARTFYYRSHRSHHQPTSPWQALSEGAPCFPCNH